MMDVSLTGVSASVPSSQPEKQPVFPVGQVPSEKPKEEHAPDQVIKKKDIENAVNKMNDFIEPHRTALHYAYHEKLHTYFVQIVDSQTNKVIKEIPPKKFLDMYAAMAERLGFIVDEKV